MQPTKLLREGATTSLSQDVKSFGKPKNKFEVAQAMDPPSTSGSPESMPPSSRTSASALGNPMSPSVSSGPVNINGNDNTVNTGNSNSIYPSQQTSSRSSGLSAQVEMEILFDQGGLNKATATFAGTITSSSNTINPNSNSSKNTTLGVRVQIGYIRNDALPQADQARLGNEDNTGVIAASEGGDISEYMFPKDKPLPENHKVLKVTLAKNGQALVTIEAPGGKVYGRIATLG